MDFVPLQDKFDKMYVTKDVYTIYNWLLKEYGWPTLPEIPQEKRVLAYEDVFPILYLKYRLYSGQVRKNIRHLVIDEMQDYSYLQYVILQNMFSCNMTILGDRAQTVDHDLQDVQTFLPKIFGKKLRCLAMNKSYLNTIEIAKYAAEITGVCDVKFLERHGKPVEEKWYHSKEAALQDVLTQVEFGVTGYETAAVLVMTEAQAKEAYEYLNEQRKDVYYIDRDSSAFQRGITVTTYYLAKGLEFDSVHVAYTPVEEKLTEYQRQILYIGATRALHELYVYSID